MGTIIQGNFPAKPKIKAKPPVKGAKKKPLGPAYQLKISLLHAEPPIWRRVLVPANMTLARLHDVIQIGMGWTDTHLHQYLVGKHSYGPSGVDAPWSEVKTRNEKRYTLASLEADMGRHCTYEYDFGDGWLHEIELEKVIPVAAALPYPVLVDGARACPPEDIGGIPGYEEFVAAMADPECPEYDDMLAWYGRPYDPDALDIAAINAILKKMK